MAQPAEVLANLRYLKPGSPMVRRYVSSAAELNLGDYEDRPVLIRDARPRVGSLSLEKDGFLLAWYPSLAAAAPDPLSMEAVYLAETRNLLLSLTGAGHVALFGIARRSAANYRTRLDPLRRQITAEPTTDVHVDYTPDRVDRLAQEFLAPSGIPFHAVKRYMAFNVWRAISPPPQDWPLALCDGNSVGDEEGIAGQVVPVNTLPHPTAIPAHLPPGSFTSDIVFHYSQHHRWHYFPNMTPAEALVFRLYDSARTSPWRTPHASFADTSAVLPVTRESLEIRSIVYYF